MCRVLYQKDHDGSATKSKSATRSKDTRYTAAAEKVLKKPGAIPYIGTLLCFVGIIVALVYHKDNPDLVGGIFGLGFIASVFIYYIWHQKKLIENSIAEIETTRPGFRAFYEDYVSRREAEQAAWERQALKDLATDLAIGLIGSLFVGGKEMLKHIDIATPAESGVELRLSDIARKINSLK